MLSLIALASLGGTLLGIRYRVLVLFLASSFGLFAAIANSITQNRDLGGTALTVLAILSVLQLAYLIGCAIRVAQDGAQDGRIPATQRFRAQ